MSVTVPIYGFGGGGGGTGGTLTVTAPAGVTVEVSKDGRTKRKTANAEGLAVFKGLESGTWTLTITDGNQTATQTVDVNADYSAVIAFFAATINITYPSGSNCTCTDGITTLTAPDTSGTWACVVHNTGTWTVRITNGAETAEETASITADGQSKNVSVDYYAYLFSSKVNKMTVTECSNKDTLPALTDGVYSFEITDNENSWSYHTGFRTDEMLNLADIKTLYVKSKSLSTSGTGKVAVSLTTTGYSGVDESHAGTRIDTLASAVVASTTTLDGDKIWEIDVSKYDKPMYVYIVAFTGFHSLPGSGCNNSANGSVSAEIEGVYYK